MANLTITVDDDTLKRARLRALEQGTSVNQVLRDYLSAFAGGGADARWWRDLFALADAAPASSGPEGRAWHRDDLYDRG